LATGRGLSALPLPEEPYLADIALYGTHPLGLPLRDRHAELLLRLKQPLLIVGRLDAQLKERGPPLLSERDIGIAIQKPPE
jgi:hypothetical protein